jgi:hypothetical protein
MIDANASTEGRVTASLRRPAHSGRRSALRSISANCSRCFTSSQTELGAGPLGEAPDRFVGFGRPTCPDLEGVLLTGEEVDAHVDARLLRPVAKDRPSSTIPSSRDAWM